MRNASGLWAVHEMTPGDVAARVGPLADKIAAMPSSERERGTATLLAAAGLATERPPEWGVAVVPLKGTMLKDCGPVAEAFFGCADTARLTREVDALRTDEKVGGVVFRVDSPGGSVDGLAELSDAIVALSKAKPVAVQVEGLCASAAYLVLCGAESMHAGRMDLIGSIGTRMLLYDFSKMFDEAGIRPVVIDTGALKSAGAMGTEITAEQETYFREIAEAYFADFAAAVKKGRGLSAAQLKASADGAVYLAKDAQARGLIDGVRGLSETIAATMKAASAGKGASRRRTARAMKARAM